MGRPNPFRTPQRSRKIPAEPASEPAPEPASEPPIPPVRSPTPSHPAGCHSLDAVMNRLHLLSLDDLDPTYKHDEECKPISVLQKDSKPLAKEDIKDGSTFGVIGSKDERVFGGIEKKVEWKEFKVITVKHVELAQVDFEILRQMKEDLLVEEGGEWREGGKGVDKLCEEMENVVVCDDLNEIDEKQSDFAPLADITPPAEYSKAEPYRTTENSAHARDCRDLIVKDNGCRFVVTSKHHVTDYSLDVRDPLIELPFGAFEARKLKSKISVEYPACSRTNDGVKVVLMEKLQLGIPLDRISISADSTTDWEETAEHHRTKSQTRKKSKSKLQMTPEDWHHILSVCSDEDFDDFDAIWQHHLPSVSGDFLCNLCEEGLPRPSWQRVRELKGERE